MLIVENQKPSETLDALKEAQKNLEGIIRLNLAGFAKRFGLHIKGIRLTSLETPSGDDNLVSVEWEVRE